MGDFAMSGILFSTTMLKLQKRGGDHMSIDLHTVTFEGDARLLELQLISIDRFVPPEQIGLYRITINASRPELNDGLHKQVVDFLYHWINPTLRSHFQIVQVEKSGALGGWRRQQLLKLQSVATSQTDHAIVLDAKNHFIRPANLDQLFAPDGRAKTVFGKPPPLFMDHIQSAHTAFGLTYDGGPTMPTITPYVMVPALVREMISSLESALGKPFEEAFDSDPILRKSTEFFLYYAFLTRRGLVDRYYVDAPKIGETLFASWPQDHAIVERLLTHALTDRDVLMFGLHRLRLPQLLDREREMIAELWQPLDLPDPVTYYLTPGQPVTSP